MVWNKPLFTFGEKRNVVVELCFVLLILLSLFTVFGRILFVGRRVSKSLGGISFGIGSPITV